MSFSGTEIVSPRSMLLRVTMHRVLDDGVAGGLAVISRPSRIGTPELISVDSVRQNRATAILRRMLPSTGSFSSRRRRRGGRLSVA